MTQKWLTEENIQGRSSTSAATRTDCLDFLSAIFFVSDFFGLQERGIIRPDETAVGVVKQMLD
jgi:hypothetical protein